MSVRCSVRTVWVTLKIVKPSREDPAPLGHVLQICWSRLEGDGTTAHLNTPGVGEAALGAAHAQQPATPTVGVCKYAPTPTPGGPRSERTAGCSGGHGWGPRTSCAARCMWAASAKGSGYPRTWTAVTGTRAGVLRGCATRATASKSPGLVPHKQTPMHPRESPSTSPANSN